MSKIRLSLIFLDFPTFTFPFSCPIFLNIWGGACATVSLMFLVSLFDFHFYITVSKIRLSPIFLDFPTFTFPFSYFPLSCPIFLNIWGGACATVSLMFLVSGTWPSSDNLTAQTYTYTCTLNTFTHLCTMYVYLYFTYIILIITPVL